MLFKKLFRYIRQLTFKKCRFGHYRLKFITRLFSLFFQVDDLNLKHHKSLGETVRP